MLTPVPDLLDQLRLMRDASAIERAHIKPHLLRYSNGQHTHDMLSLILLCWKADHEGDLPRAELLVAAHTHDMGEIVTGDVPSPTKDTLGQQLHDIDGNVERWLGLSMDLSDEERRYLQAADKFELWLWCWDEHERGNCAFKDWLDTLTSRWRDNPLPPAFEALRRQVIFDGAVGHVNNDQIRAAGGL